MTSQDMLHSLGLMVHLKKVNGVTKADCQGISDYHEFLADVEQQAAGAAAVVGFNAAHPFVELADITLTQLQYSDAVEQMYDGDIHYMSLSLPYPAPAPIPLPNRPSYFDTYVGSLAGDGGRTEADVDSILARMNDILAGREPTRSA